MISEQELLKDLGDKAVRMIVVVIGDECDRSKAAFLAKYAIKVIITPLPKVEEILLRIIRTTAAVKDYAGLGDLGSSILTTSSIANNHI